MMRHFIQDLQYAIRTLRRAPGLAVAAVTTIALAVGANTAMFSAVDGVLLRPLPYADPDRIVQIWEEHPGGTPLVKFRLSTLTWDSWAQPRTIAAIGAFNERSYTVSGGNGEAERLAGAAVTASLFPLLGSAPVQGRFFTPDDEGAGAADVVVLSHGYWQHRFGGNPSALGASLVLDGRPHTIVGVAPRGFYFPDRAAQLWTPYTVQKPKQGSISTLSVLARLAPGASLAQVEAEGTGAARGVARPAVADLMFGHGQPVQVRARTLSDSVTGAVRPALVVLAAAVVLILMGACANVANLLLARGIARSRELAVRSALGASRGRLAAQLLTEGAALGCAGGLAGAGLAWLLVRALPAWAPDQFPRLDDVQIDLRVLAFAAAVSLISGCLAAVLPAVRASRAELTPGLRADDGRTTGGGERIRAVLMAAEAAIGVVLVVSAVLLARSFISLVSVDKGFDPDHVLTARVYLPGATPGTSPRFVDALVPSLARTPGVRAAAAGNMAPFGDSVYVSAFNLPPAREMLNARAYVVTPGYAEALGLTVREGRFLAPADTDAPIKAMVVNRAFVRSYLSDGRPIVGRRYKGVLTEPEAYTEIVGVVDDVLMNGLDTEPQPEIYLVHRKEDPIRREVNVLVRAQGDPASVAQALRRAVHQIEPNAALARVEPLSATLGRSVSRPRFAAAVLGGLALLGLAVAVSGLYAVLSYNVSSRRRELGVRAALGATRRDLLLLTVRSGVLVTAAGVLAGLGGAVLAARAVRPLLFGVAAFDPVSVAAAAAIFLVVAVLASALPAMRGARVDPAEVLRA